MATSQPFRIKSISAFHTFRGLKKPEHPLISVINLENLHKFAGDSSSIVLDFYSISLKRNFNAKIKYGQQEYDFDEGIMFFISPGQVFRIEVDKDAPLQQSGWMLLVHPDFLWGRSIARDIGRYEYFDYSSNEALFLSEKEEAIIIGIMQQIQQEYHSNIDKFSQDIIIAQLEVLLNYGERFYERQFITRKISNHVLFDRLEKSLDDYFNSKDLISKGLPTVQSIAAELQVSTNYLSSLLKLQTGQTTQQHIHGKLIEIAKEKLSTSNRSVSEIAYELGFEHPQSFSKLFKIKTNQSPLEFRQAFN